jgi:hypothetical protein
LSTVVVVIGLTEVDSTGHVPHRIGHFFLIVMPINGSIQYDAVTAEQPSLSGVPLQSNSFSPSLHAPQRIGHIPCTIPAGIMGFSKVQASRLNEEHAGKSSISLHFVEVVVVVNVVTVVNVVAVVVVVVVAVARVVVVLTKGS